MRREFPARVKLAAWTRCNGHCEDCGRKIIGIPEYDHIRADGLGGEPTLENCMVLCGACHRIKTHTHDRPIMADADRAKKAAAGIKGPRRKIKSRGFPKSERRKAVWLRKEGD